MVLKKRKGRDKPVSDVPCWPQTFRQIRKFIEHETDRLTTWKRANYRQKETAKQNAVWDKLYTCLIMLSFKFSTIFFNQPSPTCCISLLWIGIGISCTRNNCSDPWDTELLISRIYFYLEIVRPLFGPFLIFSFFTTTNPGISRFFPSFFGSVTAQKQTFDLLLLWKVLTLLTCQAVNLITFRILHSK